MKLRLTYYLIRALTWPISLLSYRQINCLGRGIGYIGYYLSGKYRKIVMNNLSIAKDLSLSLKGRKKVAIEAFQNLAIVSLEYFRLGCSKNNLEEIIVGYNREVLEELIHKGQGVVLLGAHQANWEVVFLDLSSRFPSMCIGRPIENNFLYRWILSIREMFGGRVIPPNNALSDGVRELKKGKVMAIVGDQGMPDSPYSSDFLGAKAWSSPAPALVACRAGCPIVVFTTVRKDSKYHVCYHPPIYPDSDIPVRQDVIRIMDSSLKILTDSIKENPGQWLWQHKRWKRQPVNSVEKKYRYDFILIVLPRERECFLKAKEYLKRFLEVYPLGVFYLMMPKEYHKELEFPAEEVFFYDTEKDCLLEDWRFQLVFDYTEDTAIRKHYLSRGAFEVLGFCDPAIVLK